MEKDKDKLLNDIIKYSFGFGLGLLAGVFISKAKAEYDRHHESEKKNGKPEQEKKE